MMFFREVGASSFFWIALLHYMLLSNEALGLIVWKPWNGYQETDSLGSFPAVSLDSFPRIDYAYHVPSSSELIVSVSFSDIMSPPQDISSQFLNFQREVIISYASEPEITRISGAFKTVHSSRFIKSSEYSELSSHYIVDVGSISEGSRSLGYISVRPVTLAGGVDTGFPELPVASFSDVLLLGVENSVSISQGFSFHFLVSGTLRNSSDCFVAQLMSFEQNSFFTHQLLNVELVQEECSSSKLAFANHPNDPGFVVTCFNTTSRLPNSVRYEVTSNFLHNYSFDLDSDWNNNDNNNDVAAGLNLLSLQSYYDTIMSTSLPNTASSTIGRETLTDTILTRIISSQTESGFTSSSSLFSARRPLFSLSVNNSLTALSGLPEVEDGSDIAACNTTKTTEKREDASNCVDRSGWLLVSPRLLSDGRVLVPAGSHQDQWRNVTLMCYDNINQEACQGFSNGFFDIGPVITTETNTPLIQYPALQFMDVDDNGALLYFGISDEGMFIGRSVSASVLDLDSEFFSNHPILKGTKTNVQSVPAIQEITEVDDGVSLDSTVVVAVISAIFIVGFILFAIRIIIVLRHTDNDLDIDLRTVYVDDKSSQRESTGPDNSTAGDDTKVGRSKNKKLRASVKCFNFFLACFGTILAVYALYDYLQFVADYDKIQDKLSCQRQGTCSGDSGSSNAQTGRVLGRMPDMSYILALALQDSDVSAQAFYLGFDEQQPKTYIPVNDSNTFINYLKDTHGFATAVQEPEETVLFSNNTASELYSSATLQGVSQPEENNISILFLVSLSLDGFGFFMLLLGIAIDKFGTCLSKATHQKITFGLVIIELLSLIVSIIVLVLVVNGVNDESILLPDKWNVDLRTYSFSNNFGTVSTLAIEPHTIPHSSLIQRRPILDGSGSSSTTTYTLPISISGEAFMETDTRNQYNSSRWLGTDDEFILKALHRLSSACPASNTSVGNGEFVQDSTEWRYDCQGFIELTAPELWDSSVQFIKDNVNQGLIFDAFATVADLIGVVLEILVVIHQKRRPW